MIKSLKNSSDLYYLVGVIILSVSIHIFSLIASRTFLSSWSLVHYPLHTALEIGGSFIAFLVASSLIVLEKNGRGTSYNYIIAMALLGMGIFDGFHSFVHAGKEFVLLHSMATLWGGSLFVLIFLPRPLRTKIKLSWCMGIGLVSVALCLLVISKPHIFPNMLRNGQFTMWAKALNIMGGIFLILTSMKFILYFVKKRNFDDFLFFLHTLLFGLAAVMFEQSQLWDAAWWGWHFLRFFAYAVAAWFVIKSVKASMREIADKELERSLILENNFFLKTILDSFEDFVFVFDQNNQYSFCSNSVVETLGYDLKKFSNKNMEEVKDIVLKSHKKKTNVLEAAIEEFYMVNLKGENVPISISIKDLTNSKRKEIGKILIFKNLIKLKLRENLINLQKEKIINSSKLASLGEMAGGIAHEINNPLTIISSSTYVLKKIIKKGKLSEDSVNKVISDIETTVNRISKIINGLKTVSRDSSGFSLEKTTLGEIFSDVLGLIQKNSKRYLNVTEFNSHKCYSICWEMHMTPWKT